jgi:hypothetical protein
MNKRQFLISCGILFTALLPARAQDKAELLNQWRHDSYLGMQTAVLAERLVDFKMSPKWWNYFVNDADGRNTMRNMVDALGSIANNLGYGDVGTLDSTRDSTSPLFLEAVDSWKDKLHMTIVIDQDLDDKAMALFVQNFGTSIVPIGYSKPVSGRYNLTIKMNPKAKAYSYKGDKQKANFTLELPVYVPVSQSYLQDTVKRATD